MIMKTNYETLKKIKDEIKEFKYTMADIDTVLNVRKWEIDNMYDNEPMLLEYAFERVTNIKALLDSLTSGMKNMLEESDVDFESYDWCVGKVVHCEAEILNYLESFENFLDELDFVIENRLMEYEILCEQVNEEEFEECE